MCFSCEGGTKLREGNSLQEQRAVDLVIVRCATRIWKRSGSRDPTFETCPWYARRQLSKPFSVTYPHKECPGSSIKGFPSIFKTPLLCNSSNVDSHLIYTYLLGELRSHGDLAYFNSKGELNNPNSQQSHDCCESCAAHAQVG